MKRKIIYIDLDDTLADYSNSAKVNKLNPDKAKHIKGFFKNLKPLPNAIESYDLLSKYFNVYILSTAPWSNPDSLVEKMEWVQKYLPNAYKNVIFSHHKELNIGDYLIDDSKKNGAFRFSGEHIEIGSNKFPNWESVIQYIFKKENIKL